MAKRSNWHKVGQQSLMRRSGWEAHDGSSSSPLPPDLSRSTNRWRPPPSKALLRARAQQAVSEWDAQRVNEPTSASDDDDPPW